MTNQREDGQSGFFEHVVTDDELEAACAKIADDDLRETVKGYEAAVTLRREKVRAMKDILIDKFGEGVFETGARIRVGRYVLTVKNRTGGGFEMPEWESVGVSSQVSAD